MSSALAHQDTDDANIYSMPQERQAGDYEDIAPSRSHHYTRLWLSPPPNQQPPLYDYLPNDPPSYPDSRNHSRTHSADKLDYEPIPFGGDGGSMTPDKRRSRDDLRLDGGEGSGTPTARSAASTLDRKWGTRGSDANSVDMDWLNSDADGHGDAIVPGSELHPYTNLDHQYQPLVFQNNTLV